VTRFTNRSDFARFSIGDTTVGFTGDCFVNNTPVLVPVLWSTAISGAPLGDYFSGFNAPGIWTVDGGGNPVNLSGVADTIVGVQLGATRALAHPSQQLGIYTNGAAGELFDQPCYIELSANTMQGGNAGFVPNRLSPFSSTSSVAIVDTIVAAKNAYAPNAGITVATYSTYPEAGKWTLEQYLPQLAPLGLAWQARGTYSDNEHEMISGIHGNNASSESYYDGSFGSYVSLESSEGISYHTVAVLSRCTVDRFTHGQDLLTVDLGVHISGNVKMQCPTAYHLTGDNYFISYTSPQTVGTAADVASTDQAVRFSWNFNNVDGDSISTGGRGAQWEDHDAIILNHGDKTVLGFIGSGINGRRYSTTPIGSVTGSIGPGSLGYVRFLCPAVSFDNEAGIHSITITENSTVRKHTSGSAEVGAAPLSVSDIVFGQYHHGGNPNGDRFTIRTPGFRNIP